jgi:hypothetical protein
MAVSTSRRSTVRTAVSNVTPEAASIYQPLVQKPTRPTKTTLRFKPSTIYGPQSNFQNARRINMDSPASLNVRLSHRLQFLAFAVILFQSFVSGNFFPVIRTRLSHPSRDLFTSCLCSTCRLITLSARRAQTSVAHFGGFGGGKEKFFCDTF